jgi:peptide/nickel transport system permease protein
MTESQRRWARFRKNRLAVGALGVLVLVHVVALLAPLFAPFNPEQINLLQRFAPMSPEHLLGTDENGRDVLSRLMHGGRVSLGVGFASVLAAMTIGIALGGIAGYFGGTIDALIMRVADGMLSIPLFFFMLTALALFGSTLPNLIAAIALTSWMAVARVVRSEVLSCKALEYVEAAHAVGANHLRILWRHILPQALPSVIVAATLGVAYAILTESALSYLGLGVRPPTPSWGNMLSGARSYLWTAPHLAMFPGLLILLTVLAYNSLGDGLRDALSS